MEQYCVEVFVEIYTAGRRADVNDSMKSRIAQERGSRMLRPPALMLSCAMSRAWCGREVVPMRSERNFVMIKFVAEARLHDLNPGLRSLQYQSYLQPLHHHLPRSTRLPVVCKPYSLILFFIRFSDMECLSVVNSANNDPTKIRREDLPITGRSSRGKKKTITIESW